MEKLKSPRACSECIYYNNYLSSKWPFEKFKRQCTKCPIRKLVEKPF